MHYLGNQPGADLGGGGGAGGFGADASSLRVSTPADPKGPTFGTF